MTTDLIDRYVYEVGQNLPYKKRADLEAEIRSLLEDTLASRASEAGRPVDEEMTVAVLKDFGAPEKVAESYSEPRYLIGPRFFPTFWLVIRIVASVLGVLALVGLGLKLTDPDLVLNGVPGVIMKSLAEFFNSILIALGNIVIVFAILERFVPRTSEKEEDWNPRKLARRPAGEKVGPVGAIIEIVLNFVAILLFNLYPNVLVIANNSNGVWRMAPLFTDAFFAFVPLLSILWALEIVRNILLLRSGVQTTALRIFSLGLSLATIALLIYILVGPIIINTGAFVNIPNPPVEELGDLFKTLYRSIFAFIIVMEAVDFFSNLIKLVKQGWKKSIQ